MLGWYPWYHSCCVGQAANPWPEHFPSGREKGLVLASHNTYGLKSHHHGIAAYPADIFAIQEADVASHDVREEIIHFQERGKRLYFGDATDLRDAGLVPFGDAPRCLRLTVQYDSLIRMQYSWSSKNSVKM